MKTDLLIKEKEKIIITRKTKQNKRKGKEKIAWERTFKI